MLAVIISRFRAGVDEKTPMGTNWFKINTGKCLLNLSGNPFLNKSTQVKWLKVILKSIFPEQFRFVQTIVF